MTSMPVAQAGRTSCPMARRRLVTR
jgi:hypothetical protein